MSKMYNLKTKTWAIKADLGYGADIKVHVVGQGDERGCYNDIVLEVSVSGETNGGAKIDMRLDYMSKDEAIDELIKALQEAREERNRRDD